MYNIRGGEERKGNWFDRLVQVLILVVAIYGIVQNRIVWIWVWVLVLVPVLFLLLQILPFLQRWATSIRLKRREHDVLTKYKTKFQGLVKQAYQFICGQNELSIPNRVRQIATKPGVKIPEFNSHVENLFYDIMESIQRRTYNDIETFEDFEQISLEFFQAMNSVGLIYVDDFIINLKRAEGFVLINKWELDDLRKCFASFNNFIHQHNTYRNELAADLGHEAVCLIRAPIQVL